MPKIKYNQAFIEVAEDSILLDSLLSSGNSIPYSCRSGTCQSCLMKSESKNLPTKSQEGLHPNQKIQGYLLACQHQVTEDIEVCMPSDAGLDIFCNIHSLKLLNDNVMQVTLKPQKPLTAEPGQYINLIYNNSLARSYSIASIHDDLIELHVKNVKNGRMSNILFNYAKVGHEFMLRGPIGNCFYSNQHHNNT
ncbi:MAG: 2Fe-2S iron-sulfur cluster binding domain-containing protein, partial [Alphaproteobacteria bacterium]|nr:2Fe-2S iron-sulfur cluster binding domain-containing protein [Alphaproteobacteria bacterium]